MCYPFSLEKFKKKRQECLVGKIKPATFAPAFEKESSRPLTEWSRKVKLRKNFFKKSSPKIWRVFEKLLIFASAFTKKMEGNQLTRVLWKTYINRTEQYKSVHFCKENVRVNKKNRQLEMIETL